MNNKNKITSIAIAIFVLGMSAANAQTAGGLLNNSNYNTEKPKTDRPTVSVPGVSVPVSSAASGSVGDTRSNLTSRANASLARQSDVQRNLKGECDSTCDVLNNNPTIQNADSQIVLDKPVYTNQSKFVTCQEEGYGSDYYGSVTKVRDIIMYKGALYQAGAWTTSSNGCYWVDPTPPAPAPTTYTPSYTPPYTTTSVTPYTPPEQPWSPPEPPTYTPPTVSVASPPPPTPAAAPAWVSTSCGGAEGTCESTLITPQASGGYAYQVIDTGYVGAGGGNAWVAAEIYNSGAQLGAPYQPSPCTGDAC